jgi:hypothetical protein
MMVTLIVLSPLLNSMLFTLAARYVYNRHLQYLVFFTMFASLVCLFGTLPAMVAGDVFSASAGA